jgi:hypothetical protein
VSAAGLRVEINSANLRARKVHRSIDYRRQIEISRSNRILKELADIANEPH